MIKKVEVRWDDDEKEEAESSEKVEEGKLSVAVEWGLLFLPLSLFAMYRLS